MKMTSSQMAAFGAANKDSEIGRIATEMASAMKSYQTAKQASSTIGTNTSVSLASVTNNMSEQDAKDLDNYFRFNHADKAEQIQKQTEKYEFWFGFFLMPILVVFCTIILLAMWGVSVDILMQKAKQFLTGFNIGDMHVSITSIILGIIAFFIVLLSYQFVFYDIL